MNNIINGILVRDSKEKELLEKIEKLDTKLTLVVISVGDNQASKIYINAKEKMAKRIGYNFINLHFDYIEEKSLIKKIKDLNDDFKVTGIIVQLPLPDYLNKNKILNTISPLKDVDGLTDINLLKLIRKEDGLKPCTPLGIVSLIDYYNIALINKNVVIIGRSDLVGLPLFHMLLSRNATITLCHSKTENLKSYTSNAEGLNN